jgi:spore coat protein A
MERLLRTMGTFAVVALLLSAVSLPALAQPLLDATSHPKFVNPLPIPARIDVTAGGKYDMEMKETVQWLGLYNPAMMPLMTTVWGYGQPDDQPGFLAPSYPGPTFVAMRDVPLDIKWKNKLPRYPKYAFPGYPGGHLLPVDPTLHMAHPAKGGIPTVVHLHGGHTESASDGLPEAWFTQGFKETGPFFVKQTYHYDNDQEAATLWYHDHALGITRLNVYAGLAGFYLLRDDNENMLLADGVIPAYPYEVEIVIQDRMFTGDGALFFPSENPEIEDGFEDLPPGPSAIAEFFGDFILVNGVAWPALEVEPRKYRLRFLNGSDSRFYVLEFHDAEDMGTAQEFYQIGTDNGLLVTPVPLTRLLIAPGERADLVVDFDGQTELYLRNFGPDDPFKGFNMDGTISDGAGGVAPPADPATTGQIMKFDVSLPLDGGVTDASVTMGTVLRPDIMPLVQNGSTRNLVLFEGRDEYGRLQPLLGTLEEGSLAWFEPITENPMVDDVEVWEVYNSTEDAHPIHLHLVSFQILNRESFEGEVEEKDQPQHDGSFGVGGVLTVNSLGGDARPPEPNEMGWKDTAVMLPGEVTRVIARFDREGRYVWHCHILSHEDHEMMRPYYVGPMMMAMGAGPAGTEASATAPGGVTLHQNYPNPFNPATEIRFQLDKAGHAELKIYNVLGQEVRTLANRDYPAGEHMIAWDGKDARGGVVTSGMYFYRLTAGENVLMRKMLLLR